MRNDTDGFATRAIHAGESETEAATPIHLGATADAVYQRTGNPTFTAFEEKARALEGGARSVATACGMAAVSQTLLTLLGAGSRMVAHQVTYHWTRELLEHAIPRLGIQVDRIDMRDAGALDAALATPAEVVYFEPLANPSCAIIDTPAVIAAAHAAGALAVVDNTWLSPWLFRPFEHGADVVLHSATKYLNGHGDALAGVVTTRDEDVAERLVWTRNTYGGIASPLNAYLLLRGMQTLPMRMDRHCANAQVLAEWLDAHPKIARVRYPSLPDTPGHEIAKSQWRGYGGMLSFDTVDGSTRTQLLDRVRLCRPWVSLGDTGSLIVGTRGCETRVRMSVGLEDADDILRDLEQALA